MREPESTQVIYKIVMTYKETNESGDNSTRYFSYIGRGSDATVEYHPGTPARGTWPLWAFDTLENALEFLGPSGRWGVRSQTTDYQIWRAIAENIREAPPPLPIMNLQAHNIAESIAAYWTDITVENPRNLPYLPQVRGALICDTITLREQVSYTELCYALSSLA
jgi:hypothetical protein